MKYLVSWWSMVDAESPEEAAELAAASQEDGADHYRVTEIVGTRDQEEEIEDILASVECMSVEIAPNPTTGKMEKVP